MDSLQFRDAADKAIDEIATYYDTLAERPVLPSVAPGYLRPLIPSSTPENGEPWDQIQADIERVIMPGLTHWQHPKFMAFFPCNSSFPAMLGDMYSGAFNAAAFNWICSPAITELETVVMDWVAKLIALPDVYLSEGEGGGIIQGTASEVVLTALVAARERFIRRRLADMPEGEEKMDKAADMRGKLVALGSEHAHSSTQKAAMIAGTRFRTVPAPREAGFSVTAAALRKTIQDIRAKGLEPFYFTATLGSTATCAVDDLVGIALLTKEYPDVWIHVDAAYAGSALVCPEYQHLCPPLAAFDSFNFNLHKWLLVNFDCSAFFIKKRKDLIDTYSITPSYLRNDYTESGLVTDYRDWQIPLGRRFRSLKVWFVLRTYGVNGLRAFIRNHVHLGEYFHDLIKSRNDIFSVVTKPAFGLVTFQIHPTSSIAAAGMDPAFASNAEAQHREDLNLATKQVYEKINSKGEFFLTSSVVCGVYLIRVVSASLSAEEKYLNMVFEALVEAAEEGRV
ncbi:dopa decarboxylase-like protein [Dothidotthia symphoricarpi CBS 119687]|uniref:Dopa decarboxylase-like protein n=1 Tax=Dothidotthia symphoricarpi CBS 119687 TaxID=1392245 RepID=A0A6A6A5A0_9PLEO|nr:dopa decarboxylase-like protein [Dothidotthia symphoricarpi CBS 119687]KAF2126980.1 dopa decarboxylase-like protein [Dothidotthia symphoricarpi CBS 119687]